MEDFSTPQYTKRIAGAACQALPNRPWDFRSLGLLLSPARTALSQTPTPQACTVLDDLHSATLHPSVLPSWRSTGIHNLHWAAPLRPAQAWMISAGTLPLTLPSQQSIDTHNLHSSRPAPFKHTRPTLQKPTSLPQWKAPPIDPWNTIHLPPTTGELQTFLRDTHRQV
jgi:hypothetical protein